MSLDTRPTTDESKDKDYVEHIKMRIPAVQEAIKRTRFAFFLCTFAAFASFICLWNTYLSTNRGHATRALPAYHCQSNAPASCSASIEDTRRELLLDELKSWVDGQSINVNLLGIRIGVSDFAVIDSLAMYILLYYSLLAHRRENREVGQLFRDMAPNVDLMGYAAYCAINSYMVFNLNRNDDTAIRSLRRSDKPKRTPLLRGTVDLMLWAPVAVIIFIVICDLLSLKLTATSLFGSPYRDKSIWDDYAQEGLKRITLLGMDVFAMIFAVLSSLTVIKIRTYGQGTRDVLNEFSAIVKADASLPDPSAES